MWGPLIIYQAISAVKQILGFPLIWFEMSSETYFSMKQYSIQLVVNSHSFCENKWFFNIGYKNSTRLQNIADLRSQYWLTSWLLELIRINPLQMGLIIRLKGVLGQKGACLSICRPLKGMLIFVMIRWPGLLSRQIPRSFVVKFLPEHWQQGRP